MLSGLKKGFDKVKESKLFPAISSLSALILSMLRPSHAAIADFKTDSIISPI